MDLHELRKSPHLSVSGLKAYQDCSLNYKFSRIDKLPPEFKSDSLLFGSAIHATLADFYQESMTGEKMSAEKLTQVFEFHWQQLTDNQTKITFKPGKDSPTLLQEGINLLKVFHSQLVPDEGCILSIEEPFILNLDCLPVPIIGVFDLVVEDGNGVVTIIDHKTTSKAYTSPEVDKDLQLTVYQLAAKANGFQDREILLRFDCLIKTKVPKFAQYYTSRSEVDEWRVLKKITAIYEGISKGIFIPNDNSWKCSGCGYQAACQDWFVESIPTSPGGSI